MIHYQASQLTVALSIVLVYHCTKLNFVVSL